MMIVEVTYDDFELKKDKDERTTTKQLMKNTKNITHRLYKLSPNQLC